MILDVGKPEPPAEIVQRLKQIDPRLGLAMSQRVNQQTQRIEPAWAITLDWLPDDRRYELVRAGELPPDSCYDGIDFLPFDCGVGEAYGYIVRSFKAWSGSREDVKKFLERVHTFNQKRQDEILAPTLEYADELFEANAGTLFREMGKTTAKVSAVTHYPKEPKSKRDRKLREFLETGGK